MNPLDKIQLNDFAPIIPIRASRDGIWTSQFSCHLHKKDLKNKNGEFLFSIRIHETKLKEMGFEENCNVNVRRNPKQPDIVIIEKNPTGSFKMGNSVGSKSIGFKTTTNGILPHVDRRVNAVHKVLKPGCVAFMVPLNEKKG